MALLRSVNLASAAPNPHTSKRDTGIDKRSVGKTVEVRDPGPKGTGLGSGLVGDFIGDAAHHGGSDQAVYAFAREDLDDWQLRLRRELPDGFFGENLTTDDLDISDARIGERWQIGDSVVLQVTCPRIPCSTFRGWVGEVGWLKMFTRVARPGTYLRVVSPGTIRAGDAIDVVHRPSHRVSVSMVFRAVVTSPELLPGLLEAGADLSDELRETVASRKTFRLD
jgi:MOSC domain-containing protein YiiM